MVNPNLAAVLTALACFLALSNIYLAIAIWQLNRTMQRIYLSAILTGRIKQ